MEIDVSTIVFSFLFIIVFWIINKLVENVDELKKR